VLEVDVWNGFPADVQNYVTVTGATFPLLRNGGDPYYHMERDNYVVIDANGIVRYTSQSEPRLGQIGRFRDAILRSTIQTWLPSAVEPRTWSTLKEIYR
jgi:hypothetical protein